MNVKQHSVFRFGDIAVRYLLNEDTRQIGLSMVPVSMEDRCVTRRETLGEAAEIAHMGMDMGNIGAWGVDPLVHVCLEGDHGPSGWSAGMSMRNSSTTSSLKMKTQETQSLESAQRVVTTLENESGVEVIHRLEWREGESGVRSWSEVRNCGDTDIVLHMITSFNLGHLTPFAADDAPERLRLNRFRSFWSNEGRHEAPLLEELQLEPSWAGFGFASDRFGQVGSMPVRKWFPFVALEDTEAGVLWGAQLAWSGSWQMEAYRPADLVSLSGGLADREFGGWRKFITQTKNS